MPDGENKNHESMKKWSSTIFIVNLIEHSATFFRGFKGSYR
jgi:hypothetical protein